MRPLAGITVLDLGQIYAGPYCTLLLAHLGATVIKVEPLGGESTRRRSDTEEAYTYVMLGSNKRGISINLKDPRGRQIFLDLVGGADVVVENFAKGALDRLDLGYDVLCKTNPRIVLGSIKGFNPAGPLADHLAMDLTVQAMTAIMSVTGFELAPPVKAGAALCDMFGGVTLALGIASALVARNETGTGQHVEVAMQDAVIPSLASNIAGYLKSKGDLPERTGNRHGGLALAPYNVYRCADGWAAVICVRERHWEMVAKAAGRADALADPRFGSVALRARNIDAVDKIVTSWTETRPRDAVVAELVVLGVPCAPVNSLAELVEDPFHRDQGVLPEIEHPTLGAVRVFGNVIKVSDEGPITVTPAPRLGEHTDAVLDELLGLSGETLAELRSADVIG